MKNSKKLALLLASVMSFTVLGSGCAKNGDVSVNFGDIEFVNFADYKDVDDIPDWEGDSVKLTVWGRASGTNDINVGKVSSDDVVSPEILRITGVEYDKENSFDNGGSSFDARVAKMIAADDYPDIAYSIPNLDGLIDKGVLFRLDKYIEEYCPNIYKLFGPDSKVYGDDWKRQMEQYGGVYAISNSANRSGVRAMVKEDGAYDLTDEEIIGVSGVGSHDYGYFYMRDDVLKALYPQAHTVKELENIYAKNGTFTKEEIFDVPIENTQDFIDMLYDVQDYIKKNNLKDTYATFSHNGTDNWAALTQMGNVFGYNCNYFSYYDKETQEIKYTFEQDWFKNILKTWNQLVIDDVAAQEGLLDTDATHKEKLNSGKFIVTLQTNPSEEALNGQYHYRKVYCKYKYNTDKFIKTETDEASIMKISYFNKNITEEQLVQALRAMDLLASPAGQKLTYWGPKKAGLYTESADGKLQFKGELATELAKDGINDAKLKYNLDGSAWPQYPKVVASNYFPGIFYTSTLKWDTMYTPAIIEQAQTVKSLTPDIYQSSFLSNVTGCADFWNARAAFESEMTKIFASANDKEFETNYNNMVSLARKNGYDEKTLKEANEYFKESNKDYMDNLK